MSNGSPSPALRRIGRGALLAALAAFGALAVSCSAQQPAPPNAGGEPSARGAGKPGAPAATSTSRPRTAAPSRPSGPQHSSPSSSPGRGRSGPLSGKVVVLDPGHNPGNRDHSREIARTVDIGTGRKECDTSGTSTNGGYTEASFTLDVSRRIRKLLEAQGATVTFTQDGDRPYGPCVDERARIGNTAHANAVVSVHADGSATGNRGFHVILPAKVSHGDADTAPIVRPSRELGERIAGNFVRQTSSVPSNYIGDGTGLDVRSDLGGLNLSTVPKVFIECGNMRDAQDAARLTSATWRQRAAQGIADGIEGYLKS
ncbi:N-acetylmuramoyl-L-alanine amidase [Streptomyces sp. 7N604]|uniref:N-acetylmuramoyl-L-alanine amidase n=1 Tax=Streptomyces sp. 7N604 TaxID=3457415 RepID=UPI003FD581AC